MKLRPIDDLSGGLRGKLVATYAQLEAVLGPPNVEDDVPKVHDSWGFEDVDTGRKAFIWSWYATGPKAATRWSVSGDLSLITELFGELA